MRAISAGDFGNWYVSVFFQKIHNFVVTILPSEQVIRYAPDSGTFGMKMPVRVTVSENGEHKIYAPPFEVGFPSTAFAI